MTTTTTDPMAAFWDRAAAQHRKEVAHDEHDDECEWRPRFMLCHCSKRRRVAAGFSEPPGPLIYHRPSCPRCDNDVVHNGDGFECKTCRVAWSSSDPFDEGHFTDDYGTLNPDGKGE